MTEQDITCPVCGEEYDDLGLCDPNCPIMISEDDQARAEAYAIMDATQPRDLTEREADHLTLVLYRLRLRRSLMS